jgi:hypothetical protein
MSLSYWKYLWIYELFGSSNVKPEVFLCEREHNRLYAGFIPVSPDGLSCNP